MTSILAIEDNAQVLDSIQEILELENFEVSTAQNGLVGLEKVRETVLSG